MLLTVALLSVSGAAEAAEPVAVVTELHLGQGEVRVKPVDEVEWVSARLLQSLRPGDQIVATADARAVLIFAGGTGPQVLSAANSPLSVQVGPGSAGSERLRGVLGSVTQFLIGQSRKPPTYQAITVRGPATDPVLLLPRDSRVMPGAVEFQWSGPAHARYELKVLGPQAVVWSQTVTGTSLPYPASAPALRPGVRYTWELRSAGARAAPRAQFEILPADEAARVQSALSLLGAEVLPSSPPSTAALLQAGLLYKEGLHDEARRRLATAIAADPKEPTLRLLLGHLATEVGLHQLAADAFEDARELSTPTRR